MRRRALLVAFAGAVVTALVFMFVRVRETACDPGFLREGTRCMPQGCPSPLAIIDGVCDAPDVRISFPETHFTIESNDWEEVVQAKEPAHPVDALAFSIDAFEVTEGHLRHAKTDAARAAGNVTLAEAEAYCRSRGGRLPTMGEWLVAADGTKARRYPWGETGAVCRRAAWGLLDGPCGHGAEGPDTVGAHLSGDTDKGVHDLAGNVAEWVHTYEGVTMGIAKGGSYKSGLASQIRTWGLIEPPRDTRDPSIGFRCAYDAK